MSIPGVLGPLSSMNIVTAIVDAHVHLHTCYQADELLDNASGNLSRARTNVPLTGPRALYLLLAECRDDDCFSQLRALALGQQPGHALDEQPGQAARERSGPAARAHSGPAAGEPAGKPLQLKAWSAAPTAEESSVVVTKGGQQLFIVAGRQVACREGLEVLILGTTQRFEDGRPIRELLSETDPLGVPRVIPWGPGKWLFSRGRLLNRLLEEFRKPTLFLGDEGGRPGFWGYPSHFAIAARMGVRDLPGTDPLPFSHDVTKVGRMGFTIPVDLDPARPAASLIRSLTDPASTFERFATLEPPLRFVRNQIGMQLRKRRSVTRLA